MEKNEFENNDEKPENQLDLICDLTIKNKETNKYKNGKLYVIELENNKENYKNSDKRLSLKKRFKKKIDK